MPVFPKLKRRVNAFPVPSFLLSLLVPLALLGGPCWLSAQETPLDAREGALAEGGPDVRLRLATAEEALASGNTSLAVRMLEGLLQGDQLSARQREEAQLALVSAKIAEGETADAAAELEEIQVKNSSAYMLRRALVAYQQGESEDAAQWLSGISATDLEAKDLAWKYLLEGLIAERNADVPERDRLFKLARETAPTEAMRTRFDAAIYRNQVYSGNASEDALTKIKAEVAASEGEPIGFQRAKVYAVMLDQLGKRQEAIDALQHQLSLLGSNQTQLRSEFLLLLGLIAGGEGNLGRLTLRELVEKSGDRSLQRIALRTLADAARMDGTEPEFLSFIGGIIDKQQPHPLLDEMHFLRAQMRLDAALNTTEPAERERLLQLAKEDAALFTDPEEARFPGSPLKDRAIRVLAVTAWKSNPPQYRTAASFLNELRSMSKDPAERARLAVLVADSYYLNQDFGSAADAYGVALRESLEADRDASESLMGSLLFRRLMANIKAGQLEKARQNLNEDARLGGADPLNRWRAEWNLVNAMKAEGQAEEALRRVRRLISDAGEDEIPPELRLRLMWLEAQLSVQTQSVPNMPYRARRIFEVLAQVPEEALPQEQRDEIVSRTLLLEGQALVDRLSVEVDLEERQALLEEAEGIFAELRSRFPESKAAALSLLIQARQQARSGKAADARKGLLALVENHPDSEYAPVALYEAALNADQQGRDAWKEAISLLNTLFTNYPSSPLAYPARLRQVDLHRRLHEYLVALGLLEELLEKHPQHALRLRTELAKADTLSFWYQKEKDELKLDDALALYERLFGQPGAPPDFAVEAGAKWANAVETKGNLTRAEEIYSMITTRYLSQGEPPAAAALGPTGRYWLSRSLFGLARLSKALGKPEQVRRTYSLIVENALPGENLAMAELAKLRPAGEGTQGGE